MLKRPSVKQSGPSSSSGAQPMARSVAEGVWVSEAQAEPEDAAMPARSRSSSTLIGLDSPEHDAQVMRQPGASRAGHTAIDHGVEQLFEKLVAQGGQSRRLAVAALRPHQLGGHAEPDQGGQVLGAGSVPALLASAQDLRAHLQLGPDPERARARRAVDVIARERQEIDPHRVDGERHPPEGAHGVDVQGHARRAREPADLAERLQRPDLRARGADRNEGGLGAERTAQGVEHHAPLAVDGEGHDRGAPPLELPTRIDDGDVLDGRDDDPRAARAARAERHAL